MSSAMALSRETSAFPVLGDPLVGELRMAQRIELVRQGAGEPAGLRMRSQPAQRVEVNADREQDVRRLAGSRRNVWRSTRMKVLADRLLPSRPPASGRMPASRASLERGWCSRSSSCSDQFRRSTGLLR